MTYKVEDLASVIQSKVDTTSELYQSNFISLSGLVETHEKLLEEKILPGGSLKSRQRHLDKGKMLPRQRYHIV